MHSSGSDWEITLRSAQALAVEWLKSLPEREVARSVDAADIVSRLERDLPQLGIAAPDVLSDLMTALEPGLVASGGPRYFGFVTGGAYPVAIGADWLVSATDQDAATQIMSPAASAIEEVTARWVLQLLGLPSEATVGFVTGAQMANVSCLAAARHALLAADGWNVEEDGLLGAPPVTVLIGEEAHATVVQSLKLLGFGAARARRIPADDSGRMNPAELRRELMSINGPALVCSQVGHVNTGASDDLTAIADETENRENSWLHVDGAFGLWAAASPAREALVAGVDRADSWAVDAHKWLNVPYDSGMAIVRDGQALGNALAVAAPYLQLRAQSDPSTRTPENSRRARAIPIYATLRHLGRRGVSDLVERCCVLARQAATELAAHPGVQILNKVELNQVLFRVDEVDPVALSRNVADDGVCWLGTTVWRGVPALRMSVSNWSTTADDITRSTARILACIPSA